MRGLIAWALAMSMLAILVTSPHTVYGSVSAQTQQRTALFGQVAEILPMGTDLVTILLDTPEGARLLSVTRNTVLRMPGREPPSLAKLLKGDSLAAIAQESDGELKVLELVVKPRVGVLQLLSDGWYFGAARSLWSMLLVHFTRRTRLSARYVRRSSLRWYLPGSYLSTERIVSGPRGSRPSWSCSGSL